MPELKSPESEYRNNLPEYKVGASPKTPAEAAVFSLLREPDWKRLNNMIAYTEISPSIELILRDQTRLLDPNRYDAELPLPDQQRQGFIELLKRSQQSPAQLLGFASAFARIDREFFHANLTISQRAWEGI